MQLVLIHPAATVPSSGDTAQTLHWGEVKPLNIVQDEQAVTDRPLCSISDLLWDLHKVTGATLLWSNYAVMAFSAPCQKKHSCALFLIRISVLFTQAGSVRSGSESEGGLEDNLGKFASDCCNVQQTTAQCTAVQASAWNGWEPLYSRQAASHQENENDALARGTAALYAHTWAFSDLNAECGVEVAGETSAGQSHAFKKYPHSSPCISFVLRQPLCLAAERKKRKNTKVYKQSRHFIRNCGLMF